jgi:hypothetical protein
MYMVKIQIVYWYDENKDGAPKYSPKQIIAWVSSFKLYLFSFFLSMLWWVWLLKL